MFESNSGDLNKIRRFTKKWLKRGDLTKKAGAWGIKLSAASSILIGRSNGQQSQERLFELFELAKQHKAEKENRLKEITQSVNA